MFPRPRRFPASVVTDHTLVPTSTQPAGTMPSVSSLENIGEEDSSGQRNRVWCLEIGSLGQILPDYPRSYSISFRY